MSLVEVAVILLCAHHLLIVFILDQVVLCTFNHRLFVSVLANLIFVCLVVMLEFALKLLLTLIEDLSVNALVLPE